MQLKKLRQILKSLADDTRLRILNVLSQKELMVKAICGVLNISQPTASKHLVRLRLLKIVIDRREGNYIYYRLNSGSDQGKIVKFVISNFGKGEVFAKDINRLRTIKY